MSNVLILLLIFVINIILIVKLGKLKEHVAAGFELTLAGCFLAGYWFGFIWGIVIAIIFMATSYFAQLSFSPAMLVTIPSSAILGIFGAIVASAGWTVASSAIIGIIVYCILTDVLIVLIFGSEDIFLYLLSDLGAIFINTFMFKLFF